MKSPFVFSVEKSMVASNLQGMLQSLDYANVMASAVQTMRKTPKKPRNMVVLGMLLTKRESPMRAKRARRAKEREKLSWKKEVDL